MASRVQRHHFRPSTNCYKLSEKRIAMCPRWIKAMLPKEPKTMRPLKSHFPADACTTLTTLLQQTKEARVFRGAQAVREVVVGSHVNAVSATFHFTNSVLRKWVQRFAQHGPQGLRD